MNTNDALELCDEFAQWVQQENGPIDHTSREVDGEWSAWGNCAVGCFCRANGCTVDALLDAMTDSGDDEWQLVRELLNNSWPSTFRQLDAYISKGQQDKEDILNAFDLLNDMTMLPE